MKQLFGSLFAVVVMFGLLAGQVFAEGLNPSAGLSVGQSGSWGVRAGVAPWQAFGAKLGAQAEYTVDKQEAQKLRYQVLSGTAEVPITGNWNAVGSLGIGRVSEYSDRFGQGTLGVNYYFSKKLAVVVEQKWFRNKDLGDNRMATATLVIQI